MLLVQEPNQLVQFIKVALYIDGSLYNTATAGTGAFSRRRDILLGLNIANSRPYDDGIDDIAIWNEALTANEITALYNSGIPLTVTSNSGNYTSSANLKAYWRHNENTGSVTYDLSGNGYNGAISGATFSTPGASNVPVLSVTSSSNNATYKIGDVIPINITFGAAVTVSGSPQLTLETGSSDAVVNYASGSGGTTLTFNYTVASGHASTDLDYVGTSSLALNSGTINDANGNAATLTLASPGASGSLGANKALVIDGVLPATPTGLVATPGNAQNVLTWTANSESDLASYKVYGGTSSNPTTLLSTVSAGTQTYTHSSLTNGTLYYYRITALDNAGNETTYTSDVSSLPHVVDGNYGLHLMEVMIMSI